MLYAVGTYIDLRHLNDKVVEIPEPAIRRPSLYPVGTKILFLNVVSGLDVLKITRPNLSAAV